MRNSCEFLVESREVCYLRNSIVSLVAKFLLSTLSRLELNQFLHQLDIKFNIF